MTFFEKLALWKEEYPFLKYFLLDLSDYENINFRFPIGIILTVFAIVFPIAFFIINANKNKTAFVIKQLVRHEAFGEENAKSLAKLRINLTLSLKRMLLSHGKLASIVKIKSYEKTSYENFVKSGKKERKEFLSPDLSNAELYIEDGKKDAAEAIAAEGVSNVLKPILASIVFIAISLTLLFVSPYLLEFLNARLAK